MDHCARTLGVIGLSVLLAVACSKPEPVQTVNFRDRISIDISQQWVPMKAGERSAAYKLGEDGDMLLSFEDQTFDYGSPMSVQGVRSSIGSELNLRHGNVNARLSLGGNALLTYPLSEKEGRKSWYTHNWVVAKPFGYSAVARVAITLRVPEEMQGSPEVQAVIDSLDKQVGDAKMPAV